MPRPKDKNVIGTKWVFMKKMNEDGQVVRNKTILVYKGHAQMEGLYFEEFYTPVAKLKQSKFSWHLYVLESSKLIKWISNQIS